MLKSRIKYSTAKFVTSAPDITRLPADEGIEVAFAGRSNAGKSSALNALTNQKLARTSKTPGRTQLINTFELDAEKRLIDLPGYGYAKVPLEMKIKWQKSLGEYLQKRDSLKGLVVLMDIRHPLKDLDLDLIEWAVGCEIPVLALLTKADKYAQGKRKSEVLQVRKALAELGGDIKVHAFSSLKGIGLTDLAWTLDDWFLGPYVKEVPTETE
ncbi:ribosome biogenesis GTP-binding protein YihA/YsxC [Pseudoalteromonas xiamenensis]|uniref:ribosome biogenesis GTP-binding protein YihA/YsxC n=1 Tax=Pseudoalteromonas xiamenensis TaxID=882626 RepID=UPI0027E4A76E|nr:ribosome biogenesis GTP-binding protein YihA/YsxC [Pseudoalteromonas xiamenensis]WMN61322.1 ribosome biogenesis GTP-binding protein YihA/YsxC [Pseudoalteromonas xiamenensis]